MTDPVALGFEERGSGEVLLLVHGFPLDARMWRAQLDGLSGVRRCVAVDLRGRGRSPGSLAGYTLDVAADDLARTLDGLDVARADLCGHSMGGYVALAFLRRHRARVRSLILCATKTDADNDQARAARDAAIHRVAEHGVETLYRELAPLMLASPGAGIASEVRAMVDSTPPATAQADLAAMRDRERFASERAGVRALWVHGEADAVVPAGGARAAARALGARLVTLQGAGHLAPMERAEEFNDAVRRFLTRGRVRRALARATRR